MNFNGVEFRIGSDPEVFIKEKKSGRVVCAHGFTPGTKKYPAPLDLFDHSTVQVDGMALEFNTPPNYYIYGFTKIIQKCLSSIRRYVIDSSKYKLEISPSAEFDDEEWERAPDEAKRLGCDPDWCAYTLRVNDPPDSMAKFRTGAGHIHMGWGDRFEIDDNYKMVCAEFTKEMDAWVGLPSLLWDQDTRRRELYGKAGAFRPKRYGVEYRTPSNAWLTSTELTRYVATNSFKVAENMMSGHRIGGEQVRWIVDHNKVEEAKYFMKNHGIPLPPKRQRVV